MGQDTKQVRYCTSYLNYLPLNSDQIINLLSLVRKPKYRELADT